MEVCKEEGLQVSHEATSTGSHHRACIFSTTKKKLRRAKFNEPTSRSDELCAVSVRLTQPSSFSCYGGVASNDANRSDS